MKVAIFDFDGTIMRGNSWQILFWETLRSHSARAPGLLLELVLRIAGLRSARHLRESVLDSFAGLREKDLSAWGDRFYAARLMPRLQPRALQEISRCHSEGYTLVLATGAFDFLIDAFARENGFKYVVATRLSFEKGICLGTIDGPECRGAFKLHRVKAALTGLNVDWSESMAFSDNADDGELLQCVGRGFLVTHRRKPFGLSANIQVLDWRSFPR